MRESRGGLIERLRAAGLPVEVRRLEVGDIAIGERLVIERKTASDLLESLRDGRLFRQGWRLSRCARPLLLIEGDPWELVHCDEAAHVRGALLSLLLGSRIPVAQTGSLEETVALIVHAALQEERRRRRRARWKAEQAGGPKPPPPPDARALLEALPDVGPARAAALVARFGSVRAVAAADVDALTQVAGIGPITARRLVAALGERGHAPPALPAARHGAHASDERRAEAAPPRGRGRAW